MAHEDAGGRAFVAYDDPYHVAGRHGTKADTRTAEHLRRTSPIRRRQLAGTQQGATEGVTGVRQTPCTGGPRSG